MPSEQAAARMLDRLGAPLLAFGLVFGGWFLLGEPDDLLAQVVWPDRPAPWEEVTAVYVPDRRSPERRLTLPGLADLTGCRAWVYWQATRHGDRRMARGDWHCSVVAEADEPARLHLK
jgi:hypothetical protein